MTRVSGRSCRIEERMTKVVVFALDQLGEVSTPIELLDDGPQNPGNGFCLGGIHQLADSAQVKIVLAHLNQLETTRTRWLRWFRASATPMTTATATPTAATTGREVSPQ